MTVSLGLSILEISKALMYELGYNFVSPMYQRNAKTVLHEYRKFYIHIKTKDVFEDIPDNVEKRFDTSSYEVNRLQERIKKGLD